MTWSHTRSNVPRICVTTVPDSKFQSVLLYGQTFLSYRSFWKSAPNDPKLTLNPTRSTVPRICVTSIHESQISVRFALWPAVLRYRPFWKRYTEWPKNNLEPYKVKLPHTRYMCYWYPWLPNFTPFRSMTSRFRDTGYFETSAPNDLKKTLNPTRLKVPHMCIISIAEYQISSHFPLRPTEIPSWR